VGVRRRLKEKYGRGRGGVLTVISYKTERKKSVPEIPRSPEKRLKTFFCVKERGLERERSHKNPLFETSGVRGKEDSETKLGGGGFQRVRRWKRKTT